jgi:hypothetical protein
VSFEPENELEHALVAAATDRANAPRFYRALLDATLLIIDEAPVAGAPARRTLEPGTQLTLRHVEIEGTPHVPVFTARSRLEAFISSEVTTLSVGGRDLLAILQAAHVILNPGADYGKRLVPGEIAALLDGSIFATHTTHVVPEAREVLLAQPADYPHHLTEALKPYLAGRKDVRAAYLARYHDPARDPEPHTLIGIDASADWDSLIRGASAALDPVARPGDVVDFVRIDDSGVSRYLVEDTKPFYRKKRFGLF